jgi:hypothetical protein
MSEKQFMELAKKLDTLIKLTAINALQGKTKAQGISILSGLGFKPREIANILNTTPHSVSVVKSARKKVTTRRKAEKKPTPIEDKGGAASGEDKQRDISSNMGKGEGNQSEHNA